MYYQIDYFVVFHGKRELSERSYRKRPNSKLKWVINHRNWTIMRTNNGRFLLMFLLLCIWSEMYHLRYRLTEIDMKWQATNCWRSNSIGYKIKLFYGHFARCQNPFRNWIFWHRFDPFAISSFSCLEELLHHLTQNHREARLIWRLAKIYFKTEKLFWSMVFNARWWSIFITGLPDNYCLVNVFCDKKILKV